METADFEAMGGDSAFAMFDTMRSDEKALGGDQLAGIFGAMDSDQIHQIGEDQLLESARNAGAAGVPSFGQDVRKGRRTEIDYLNGYVSDMGRRSGVPTPFNDKIVEIVHDLGINFKGAKKHVQPLVDMLP